MKNHKRSVVICWLLSMSSMAFAQTITISAVVVDKDTREPLPFASVGIKDKSIGTITNLQGAFDFHVSGAMRNDILVVNMLGYETYEVPAWSLGEEPASTIALTKSTRILDEVVISDSLLGGDILRIALSRIESNYPMNPYLMEGFYRDVKEVAGTYVSLLEAAVSIVDEDYRAPRNKFKIRERVALQEVRRSLGYGNKFTAYFDEGNLLEDILLHNNIRYRQFPQEEEFYNSLIRQKDSYYNGNPVYVIAQQHDYSLIIYIDKQNFGILHLEYENDQQETMRRRGGLVSKFVNIRRVIDFKPFEGKLYLNYITLDSKVNWYDKDTDELRFETQLGQQLLINKILPNTHEYIGTRRKMKSYGLQYQDMPYNKEFWENYNVIKESPLDRKIIEDLEKNLPLEIQFEHH